MPPRSNSNFPQEGNAQNPAGPSNRAGCPVRAVRARPADPRGPQQGAKDSGPGSSAGRSSDPDGLAGARAQGAGRRAHGAAPSAEAQARPGRTAAGRRLTPRRHTLSSRIAIACWGPGRAGTPHPPGPPRPPGPKRGQSPPGVRGTAARVTWPPASSRLRADLGPCPRERPAPDTPGTRVVRAQRALPPSHRLTAGGRGAAWGRERHWHPTSPTPSAPEPNQLGVLADCGCPLRRRVFLALLFWRDTPGGGQELLRTALRNHSWQALGTRWDA